MFNEAQIYLTGYVATQPLTKTVKSGASYVSMRVAWTPRRQDRTTGDWVDGNTSYVTVYCWRRLASNVAVSLRTGDPVVVLGKVSVRPYEDKGGIKRIAVDVDASAIGHDLTRGVSTFRRVRPPTGMTAAEFESARAAGQIPAGSYGPGGQDGEVADGNGHAPGIGLSGRPDGSDGLADQAGDESWAPGDGDMSPPDEAERAFFDESAISEDAVAPEPAAVSS